LTRSLNGTVHPPPWWWWRRRAIARVAAEPDHLPLSVRSRRTHGALVDAEICARVYQKFLDAL
jgi:hypothetical protein